jgi:DNA-binding PadR family transcriptional regulator
MKNLPWLVLRAANRAQARGSTVRLIVLRAPEVAEELGMDLTDTRLLSVEEYLQERGYIESANILSTWGTYTITPAGLRWLEEAPSEPPEQPTEAPESVVEEPGEPHQNLSRRPEREEEVRLYVASPQEATERVSWWRRVFGG